MNPSLSSITTDFVYIFILVLVLVKIMLLKDPGEISSVLDFLSKKLDKVEDNKEENNQYKDDDINPIHPINPFNMIKLI